MKRLCSFVGSKQADLTLEIFWVPDTIKKSMDTNEVAKWPAKEEYGSWVSLKFYLPLPRWWFVPIRIRMTSTCPAERD